jgi:hypothetical protein
MRDTLAAHYLSNAECYRHAAQLAKDHFAQHRLRSRLRELMRVFALESVRYARKRKEIAR